MWSYDFVFDWCANGQKLKCLTVTDEWTKEGLAIEVDGRIRSARVIEVLSRLVSERGAPLSCARTTSYVRKCGNRSGNKSPSAEGDQRTQINVVQAASAVKE